MPENLMMNLLMMHHPSIKYEAERCRNSDLYCDHRVSVDSDSHWPRGDEADIRNDLAVHVGLGVVE